MRAVTRKCQPFLSGITKQRKERSSAKESVILAHRIGTSEILPWVRKSYLTHAILYETGLIPPVKYSTYRSKAVLLLRIFYIFVLCLLCLCALLFICALCSPAGKGLTSWLSFVVYNCEFVTFPLASWVRCGTYTLLL